MKSQEETKISDLSKPGGQLTELDPSKFTKLPPPYEDWDDGEMQQLTDDQKTRIEHGLDGISAIGLAKPSQEEQDRMVAGFLEGLQKLLTKEDNWTFLQPLMLSLENCVKCQTCNDSCPVYTESGGEDIYRPTFRAEALRRIINKYLKPGGKIFPKFRGNDIELNWETLARLAELSYRCTLCRRCAQACPIGLDNGLLTREIRKLFSQQLGINVEELHGSGTVKQLKVGSSTGMNPTALMDIIEFAEEDILERTGMDIKIPIDKVGADYLVMHNAGEFLSWPENLQAFAIIFEIAGVSWTISSEQVGYDSVNYGLFYEDVMLARIASEACTDRKGPQGQVGHAGRVRTRPQGVHADRGPRLSRRVERPPGELLPHPRGSGLQRKDHARPVAKQLPRHPARPVQRDPKHGDRGTPEADSQEDLSPVPGNDPPRREQLLLWRRQRLCHHAGQQFP